MQSAVHFQSGYRQTCATFWQEKKLQQFKSAGRVASVCVHKI